MNTFYLNIVWVKHFVMCIGFSCICSQAFSQYDMVAKALDYYKMNQYDSAKYYIDEAAVHVETADSAYTWYYRGFIYRALAKGSKEQFPLYRQRSSEYFARCLKIDPSGENADQCMDIIQNIAISYYNDAVIFVKVKGEIDLAEKSFKYYKNTLKMAFPNFDFTHKVIQFYSAIGSFYLDKYKLMGENQDSEVFWIKAKDAFDTVIKLDPNDFNANYNIAILYYNKAVNIVNLAGYDITLARLSDIQDTSIVLFRRSLPYMKTGLNVDPKNEHILEGLAGIYFALNEPDKSIEFKEKLKILKEQKGE